jgi:hypothetical protein
MELFDAGPATNAKNGGLAAPEQSAVRVSLVY